MILIGCNLLFEKRGGIVVLHIGVALLMFSELQVGFYAKENLLALEEGQTMSFMRDVRERAVLRRPGGLTAACNGSLRDPRGRGRPVRSATLPHRWLRAWARRETS